MLSFTYQSPTSIVFGEGALADIPDLIKPYGVSRALIISDPYFAAAPPVISLTESLKEAGFAEVLIFSDVPADSDVEAVEKAIAMAKESMADVIIAIGGGSVIDTAKVVNAGLTHNCDIHEFEGMNSVRGPLGPLIAVPTTAGTGAEVSAAAVIKDHKADNKIVFASRYLYPSIAVLDPLLTVSLPPMLTAGTGFDALTHVIECYVSTLANVVSDSLCLEAARLIFRALPAVMKDGNNMEARSQMLVASSMAGLAFTNAGVGIVHALAHSVGAKYGTHHGLTNAVFLPFGIAFNMQEGVARYGTFWRAIASELEPQLYPLSAGSAGDYVDDMAGAKALWQAVKELQQICLIPTRLSQLGVTFADEAAYEEIALLASCDPAIMFNVRSADTAELVGILKESG